MGLKIYLASASPRRRELLHQLGIDFEVFVPEVAELQAPGESPADYAKRIATEKAWQVSDVVARRKLPMRPVLGADTCVTLDNQVLGKPRDRDDGETMLRHLSGREHSVLTAVTVLSAGAEYSALSMSRVNFRAVTNREIARYWETGEPADKAGAYALQGRAAAFISNIEGSYSGIVGLPLYEVAGLLKKVGLEVL